MEQPADSDRSSTEINSPGNIIQKFFSSFLSYSCLYAESSGEAYDNYINLKKLYFKWTRGLFRSSRYYKKYMTEYLISIYNKEILTDYDFVITSPEAKYEKKLICNLYLERWLQVRGELKESGLSDIIKNDPGLLTKWWRSGKLVSVYGVVRDFKLETDKYGDRVVLFLKDIRIRESKAE